MTLLAALLVVGVGAPPQTLSDALADLPAASRLVVDADNVRRTGEGDGLAAFNRITVRFPGFEAVVPTTRVTFDDEFRQPPNLTAGLPRDAKVLYLLTLLDEQQVARIATAGLRVADLQGEASAVLASILPERIEGIEGAERGRLRLQVFRSLGFDLPIGSGNSITSFSTLDDPESSTETRDIPDQDLDSVFGLTVRRRVPNRPNLGDLDARDLQGSANLAGVRTVGEALAKIGAATGVEILADRRIRDLPVSGPGDAQPARDLLEGFSLAVGGAYRRVGTTYLLTSGTLGQGARQVRFAAWRAWAEGEAAMRADRWGNEVSRRGTLRAIGFRPGDPLKPSESMLRAMSANGERPTSFESAALTPALRGFLRGRQKAYPGQEIGVDRVRAYPLLHFRFLLPNGEAIHPMSGTIGPEWALSAQLATSEEQAPPPAPERVPLPAEGFATPLAVRHNLPGEARRDADRLFSLGIREVWLETESPEVIAAFAAAGHRVKLWVGAFGAPSSTPAADLDRTILGDDGPSWGARVARDPWFRNPGGIEAPAPLVEPQAVPGSPAWRTRVGALQRLARHPAVQGVVVLDAIPPGYEGRRDTSGSAAFPPHLVAGGAFGYSEGARLAFLRREGIDPIDLGWSQLRGPIDLQSDFFPNAQLERIPAVHRPDQLDLSGLLAGWDTQRERTATAALRELAAALGGRPILVERPRATVNVPRSLIERPLLPFHATDWAGERFAGARVEGLRSAAEIGPDETLYLELDPASPDWHLPMLAAGLTLPPGPRAAVGARRLSVREVIALLERLCAPATGDARAS